MSFTELDNLVTNTIRCFSADTVEKANSGHPGAPMGMAPLAHVLWSRHLRFSPSNPKWVRLFLFKIETENAQQLIISKNSIIEIVSSFQMVTHVHYSTPCSTLLVTNNSPKSN
jgi:hypothetical protein